MAVLHGLIRAALAGGLAFAVARAAPPPIGPDALRPEIEPLYEEALFALDAGDAERARALLLAVLRHDPGHAGAWLDLALLQCRAGDRRGGRVILDRLRAQFAPPPDIRALIEELASTTCAPPRQWRLNAGIALGHDSNVNLGASQAYTRLFTESGMVDVLLSKSMLARADAFAEAWAELGQAGLPLRLSLALRHYGRESQYDSHQLSAEGWRLWTDAGGRTLVRGLYVHQGLAGRPFLDSLGLEFGHHGHGCRYCAAAELRLGLQRFRVNRAYDAAVGETRLGLRLEGESYALRGWATALADYSLATRPGGGRSGPGLEFEALLRPAPGLWLQARTGIQVLRDARPYAEPLLPWRRRQRVYDHRIELRTTERRGLSGFLSWQRRASDGNLDFLDYRADSLRVGLSWTF